MPYFITDSSPDCSGWATVKEDGEVIGCHTTKQDAIDQMVAVSIAEEIEPGGERALAEKFNIGDYVMWFNGDESMQGEIVEIEFDGALNVPNSEIILLGTPLNPAALIQVYVQVGGAWTDTNNFVAVNFEQLRESQDLEEINESSKPALMEEIYDEEENRAVNLQAPSYMRAAARRGLQYHADGLSGDGLKQQTVNEARQMASGNVSEDKWRRIGPWIARHLVDLDAPKNSNTSDPQYPGAGLVAHLLWGSGPSKTAARRALAYANSVVERLDREEDRNKWANLQVSLPKEEKQKNMNKIERRVKKDVDFELRIDNAESDGMRFSGYAAVFNSDSEPLPFTERINPGAFRKSLRSRNEIKMFMNHNMDHVLASTRAKTLKLKEDDRGLLAEAILPNTSAGRDLATLMKRGDVNSMSFGFSVPMNGDSWSRDGKIRTLNEIRLHEVSIVTGFPAYEATTASVRSLDILASRTNVDADALADAMFKLEAGENLEAAQADLISEVVQKLKVQPDLDPTVLLDLKKQQIDLLYKAV
jgi:HK97 family phage prohead protease